MLSKLGHIDHHIERLTRTDYKDWGYELTREPGTGWDFTLYLGWWEVVISYTRGREPVSPSIG